MYCPIAGTSPSVEIVSRLVKNTTSNGIIIVARNTTKIVRLNGNSRNANAYAARIAVSELPADDEHGDDELLKRYEPTWPSFHASRVGAPVGVVGNERRRPRRDLVGLQERVDDRDVDREQHDHREHGEQDVADGHAAAA